MAVSPEQLLGTGGTSDARYRAARRVTLIGALVNAVLAVGKIVFGVIGHSQSLLADGVHSLSDLASDGMVLFAAKHANRAADEDHPYGHGRIETVGTVALGIFLLGVAAGLAYDAGLRLFNPEQLLQPTMLALGAAMVSVLAKEALYHYTLAVARRQRSDLLRGNAWHHRSDAISSVIVVVGIVGTLAGLPYLDALAAIGVALMIAKIGWDLSWRSLRELIDTALDPEHVRAIHRAITNVPGVKSVHMLRTRRMGPDALVDVHIQVDPMLSVSEGHKIGDEVRSRLLARFDEVQDVTVHVDPEDDEVVRPSGGLPLREQMLERLREQWKPIPEAEAIDDVTLHYLDGRVHVEVELPLDVAGDADRARALAARLREAGESLDNVREIKVLFR